ncbi:SDR family NAD(P)-dependent oxidoreductase [Parafrankia sp. EUN1f]|uniref:SDR family NAD(P)-dependent oxidoreductase n=1 Tax=Parafrankia sp. EUN1f TaxID=102897 RepID=UPI0001C44AC0|nr:SDR family NAD(P)-dependent oxidoreductase [Parafrankia sp. EUN1f]EFC83770.1 short-chain dehydrogenase/reductase SDR [Parafrankia sp. EUN1f]
MRTVVITGGTDGIGKALGEVLLERGDQVVVVGRNAEKGKAFIAAAERHGAGDRAFFLPAELSLVAESKRVRDEIRARFPVLDALVLGARHYRSHRQVTAEGFEENFALFYLSRYILSHGLVDLLAKSTSPVVMNVAGPGADISVVRWDDLELRHAYHGGAALGQGGKLNDLLGVAFAAAHGAGPVRYILFHPGVVSTSFSGVYDRKTAAEVEMLKKLGKPVEESMRQVLRRLDAPPSTPLSAFVEGRPIGVDGRSFDPAAAARLDALTREALTRQALDRQALDRRHEAI